MKPLFETSEHTRAQVDFFRSMRLSETISYKEISAALKFEVTPSSSAYARKVAERDHEVFIAVIPRHGFFRGTHADMANSGPGFLLKTRKLGKRLSSRMELALKGNLPERLHQAASEMFSRANIIHSTSEKPMVMSNRTVYEEPPVSKEKPGYGNIARIRK